MYVEASGVAPKGAVSRVIATLKDGLEA